MITLKLWKTKLKYSGSNIVGYSFTDVSVDIKIAECQGIRGTSHSMFSCTEYINYHPVLQRWGKYRTVCRFLNKASAEGILGEVGSSAYCPASVSWDSSLLTNFANVMGFVNLALPEGCVWMSKTRGGSYNSLLDADVINVIDWEGKRKVLLSEDGKVTWSLYSRGDSLSRETLQPNRFTVIDPDYMSGGYLQDRTDASAELSFNFSDLGPYDPYYTPTNWESDNAEIYKTCYLLTSVHQQETPTVINVADEAFLVYFVSPVEDGSRTPYDSFLYEPDFAPEDYAEQGNIYWNGVWHKDMYLNGHYHSSAYVRENGSWSKWWEHL